MSGNHWWPAATLSSVAAGVGQLTPSGELRTKIFDWPLVVLAAQTTCTPVASAATADVCPVLGDDLLLWKGRFPGKSREGSGIRALWGPEWTRLPVFC
jgi:hypothetical protein